MENYNYKPCPFCDETNDFEIIGVLLSEGSNDYYNPEPEIWVNAVKCNNCRAQGSEKNTEKEAVEAWNSQVKHYVGCLKGIPIYEGDTVIIKYVITKNPHWRIQPKEKKIKVEYNTDTFSYGICETLQECVGECGELVSVEIAKD